MEDSNLRPLALLGIINLSTLYCSVNSHTENDVLLESGGVGEAGVDLDAEDDGGLFGGEHDPCGGENPEGKL